MNKIRIAIILIVLLVMGIALTVGGISNIIKLNGYIPDFNYESMQNIKKGDFVQGYVQNIYDCYANETTTNTTMGIETSSRTSEEYFIMPLINDADVEKDLYITISASKPADREMLYEICDRTWDFMEGGSEENWPEMGIVARVKKIDPELLQYMTEWFEESEAYGSVSEIRQHIVPYELVIYNTSGAYTGLIVGLVIIAVIAVVGVVAYRQFRPAPLSEGSFPAYVPNETAYTPAQNTESSFSEARTPPPPRPVTDIPQPVQPDEFFARPVKKTQEAEPAETAEKPVMPVEEKPPVQTASYGDMDVLDTSALSMDSLDDPNDSSDGGEYEFLE